MRILSSAEKCRRVARRIFFTTSVAGSFSGTDFCLIFAPCEGYDEPEILPSSTHPICLMSADGGHRDAAAILLAYRHGLRAQELCSLRWSQIDLRNGRLHVNRSKGGIESVHPLHGPELRALRPLQFITEAGTPVTPAWFLRMIQRTGRAAKL